MGFQRGFRDNRAFGGDIGQCRQSLASSGRGGRRGPGAREGPGDDVTARPENDGGHLFYSPIGFPFRLVYEILLTI